MRAKLFWEKQPKNRKKLRESCRSSRGERSRRNWIASFQLTIPKMEERATSSSETRRPTTAKKMRSLPASRSELHQGESQASNLVDRAYSIELAYFTNYKAKVNSTFHFSSYRVIYKSDLTSQCNI
jgi:hypothetical protein